MTTIWKFPLTVTDSQRVEMPEGAQLLTVQLQGNQPCLWAVVDSDNETEDRYFEIYDTGNPIRGDINETAKYIATFQQGPFVWHVFETL